MLPRGGSSSAVPSGWWHLSWQQLVGKFSCSEGTGVIIVSLTAFNAPPEGGPHREGALKC